MHFAARAPLGSQRREVHVTPTWRKSCTSLRALFLTSQSKFVTNDRCNRRGTVWNDKTPLYLLDERPVLARPVLLKICSNPLHQLRETLTAPKEAVLP